MLRQISTGAVLAVALLLTAASAQPTPPVSQVSRRMHSATQQCGTTDPVISRAAICRTMGKVAVPAAMPQGLQCCSLQHGLHAHNFVTAE
jgi:hypothetical protein